MPIDDRDYEVMVAMPTSERRLKLMEAISTLYVIGQPLTDKQIEVVSDHMGVKW